MVYHSSIRLEEGEEPKVVEIIKGVYKIENAYSGSYHYFGQRDFSRKESGPSTGEPENKDLAETFSHRAKR